nr:hypothetical protein GCM10020093_007800 [Planobispora longispora]
MGAARRDDEAALLRAHDHLAAGVDDLVQLDLRRQREAPETTTTSASVVLTRVPKAAVMPSFVVFTHGSVIVSGDEAAEADGAGAAAADAVLAGAAEVVL